MVEFGTANDIKEEIRKTLVLVKQEKDNNTRMALYNYIGNLYSALSVIENKAMYPDEYKVFGSKKDYARFLKKVNFLNAKFVDNFIANKNFHQDYFNDILADIESVFMTQIDGTAYSMKSNYFGEKDFFLVFHDFCSSLKLEAFYEEIISKRRIFPMKKGRGYDDYLGLTIHNPVVGNSGILVDDFDYNLDAMTVLAHEMGHYYDLSEFKGVVTTEKFVSYTFKSVYQEVMSRLFERLFFNYLIKNKIKTENAIDKFLDFEIINHDYMFSSYILSLLKDEYLVKEKYNYLEVDTILSNVGKFFENMDSVKHYLENGQLDLGVDLNYTYGDIISMFLKEAVLEEGLQSLEMKKFESIRWQEFSKDYILQERFTPDEYINLYKKEIQLIKK